MSDCPPVGCESAMNSGREFITGLMQESSGGVRCRGNARPRATLMTVADNETLKNIDKSLMKIPGRRMSVHLLNVVQCACPTRDRKDSSLVGTCRSIGTGFLPLSIFQCQFDVNH